MIELSKDNVDAQWVRFIIKAKRREAIKRLEEFGQCGDALRRRFPQILQHEKRQSVRRVILKLMMK
ncbi:MAG TPA: hypothetical protein VLH56_08605 [Dissulfurispiraceae bacterium]|nr:hypothetical protein [Dissulfurispiraceae bacterium]